MRSFEEFEGRVDDLLTQVAGPSRKRKRFGELPARRCWCGPREEGSAANVSRFGEFNDHYDDASRWTRANP